MTHLLSKRWKILVFMLGIWLALGACQLGSAIAGTQTGSPPVGTPGVGSQDTKEPEVVNVDFGPGPFNFPDTKAGLADLTSYKATLTLSFDGTLDGKAHKWSKTYTMLSAKEPAALQLTIAKTGDLTNLDPIFMAEANGANYERSGENTCNATVIEAGNSLRDRLEPAGFLTFVIGAEEVGSETVNAVVANHYTFDERAFGQLNIVQATGELWVATDGGYIVKYVLATKGDANYFGEGIVGTLSLDYEVTDPGLPVTIELPKDGPDGLVDAPLLPDATDVLNMPGLLSFTTTKSITEAILFYQQQLPGMGWQPVGDPTIGETDGMLEFNQAGRVLSVIISTSDVSTTVNIVIGPIEP